MTYHLTPLGFGIATDRSPVPDEGNVLLTFCGCFADSVCVCGHFYPIVNGKAEIPTAALGELSHVTAYDLAAHKRYACDPILRLGEGYLAPTADPAEERLSALAITLSEAEGRIAALEADLAALGERISPTPFSFGGNNEP